MTNIFSYSLSDFSMVSTEVIADMYLRYLESIFPLPILFLVINIFSVWLIFKKPSWVLIYLALGYVFIGLVFFPGFYNELNSSGKVFQALFLVQALLLAIKGIKHLNKNKDFKLYNIGFIVFVISMLVPFSFFLSKTKELLLVSGYGPDQIALSTLGLCVLLFNSKKDFLYLIVPVLWLLNSFLI